MFGCCAVGVLSMKPLFVLSKGRLTLICRRSLTSNIPTAPNLPLVGSVFGIARAGGAPRLHEYVDSLHSSLGPIFRLKIGPSSSAVFLSHPTEMRKLFSLDGKYPKHFLPPAWLLFNKIYNCKRGLLFMDDEEWAESRRPVAHHLLKSDPPSELGHVFQAVINDLVSDWEAQAGNSLGAVTLQKLEKQLFQHSVSAVAGVLMGSSYLDARGGMALDIASFSASALGIMESTAALDSSPFPLRLASTLNTRHWKHFQSNISESLEKGHALLEKMTKAASNDGLIRKLSDSGMDKKTMESILVDLLIAAGDTTALTMHWSLYLLGLPEGAEFVEAMGGRGESDSSDVARERMARAVVKETLRLYPAAPFIGRILPQQANLLDYTLNSGEMLLLSLWSAGRDGTSFPTPSSFLPTRWMGERGSETKEANPSAFLPFALGSRSCIGSKIANHLIATTLLAVTERFKLKTLGKVGMILRPVPVPDQPIEIKLEMRK